MKFVALGLRSVVVDRARLGIGGMGDEDDDMMGGGAPAMSISVGAAEFDTGGGGEDDAEDWIE